MILRFVCSPATTTTLPPHDSTSAASSVASPPPACAARSTEARNACGVCTATSDSRGGVSTTTLSASIRLIVSVTGMPGTAAVGACGNGVDHRCEQLARRRTGGRRRARR